MDTIKFTHADWEEVVAALSSKIGDIKRGHFGQEDFPGQDKEWTAHLQRIIRKIEGPKGNGINLAVFRKPVVTADEKSQRP